MRKSVWVVLVVFLLSAMVLTACGGGGGSSSGSNDNAPMPKQPPAEFANAKNPVEGNADAVNAGKDIYAQNCVSCHGTDAKGDGPAGSALDPKPANLQALAKKADVQYMHWVVSEGGAAAGLSSAMVAYKGVLSDEQIWQVVTYLKQTYGK